MYGGGGEAEAAAEKRSNAGQERQSIAKSNAQGGKPPGEVGRPSAKAETVAKGRREIEKATRDKSSNGGRRRRRRGKRREIVKRCGGGGRIVDEVLGRRQRRQSM